MRPRVEAWMDRKIVYNVYWQKMLSYKGPPTTKVMFFRNFWKFSFTFMERATVLRQDVHLALNKHHSFTKLILYLSRKLNILCIIFKIIALFVITLFVQLYVRVGRGIATKRYGCTCIHIVFKHKKKELIN